MIRTVIRRAGRTLGCVAISTLALVAMQPAQAGTSPPTFEAQDMLGFYSGSVSGMSSGCPSGEPISTSAQITLDQANSHASGSFLTGDGDSGSISLNPSSGMMLLGMAKGSSPDGTTFDLNINGNFYPDEGKLSLTFSGMDSDGCLISLMGTFLRTTNPQRNPADDPSNLTQGEQNAGDAARFGEGIANIVRGRRTGNSGNGMSRWGEGVMVQGEAAGSGMPIGAWFGISRTSTENDFATTAFKDTRYDFLLGVDTQFDGGNGIVGVAFGIQNSDTKTTYNAGTQNLTAITVAPYVGMLLNDWLSFDATVGYSDVSIDQTRTAVGTGATLSSDVESYRIFAAANLAATKSWDSLLLTGLAGMSWATQRDDSFRESGGLLIGANSASVGRVQIGAEVAYSAGAWEPYARGILEHDFTKTSQNFAAGVAAPSTDDTGGIVAVGLRYFDKSGVSAAVEYSAIVGRDNLDEDTISANVRWEF